MDVKTAQTNIAQVGLRGMRWLVFDFCCAWELFFLHQFFVRVHDLAGLVQILYSFFICSCVKIENSSEQEVILLVEDILFVVIKVFRISPVKFGVFVVS